MIYKGKIKQKYLSYKQRVGGSTPSAPTRKEALTDDVGAFLGIYAKNGC